MKNMIKKMIAGTSLEPIVRKIYSALTKLRGVEDKNLLYDIQTFEVMKRVLREDSNCVDVGCHKGNILRLMMHLAPKGTHFAFEPLPKMYQELLESFGSNENYIFMITP